MMLCRLRRSCQRKSRQGSVTPFLLVALTLFLAAFALAFNLSAMREAKVELRTVADSSALAVAAELAHDDFLKQDPHLVPPILQQAAMTARAVANFNTYRGRPFSLDITSVNSPSSQLFFGHLTAPRGGMFTLIGPQDNGSPLYFQINAVRIVLDQTRESGNPFNLAFANITGQPEADIRLRATAMLDRAVIGFRPVTSQPVPLAPLALLSDATGTNIRSWENRVEQQNGPDQYQFNRMTHSFSSGPDQLHELEVVLALEASHLPTANVALLNIGGVSTAEVNNQIRFGITAQQLQAMGGQIALDQQQQVQVPGALLGPSNPSDAQAMHQALTALQASGQARAWPLFQTVSGGNVVVTGFVAARVTNVSAYSSDQPLQFTLQPAQLVTASALTDLARQQQGTVRMNPYLSKVRIVE